MHSIILLRLRATGFCTLRLKCKYCESLSNLYNKWTSECSSLCCLIYWASVGLLFLPFSPNFVVFYEAVQFVNDWFSSYVRLWHLELLKHLRVAKFAACEVTFLRSLCLCNRLFCQWMVECNNSFISKNYPCCRCHFKIPRRWDHGLHFCELLLVLSVLKEVSDFSSLQIMN